MSSAAEHGFLAEKLSRLKMLPELSVTARREANSPRHLALLGHQVLAKKQCAQEFQGSDAFLRVAILERPRVGVSCNSIVEP